LGGDESYRSASDVVLIETIVEGIKPYSAEAAVGQVATSYQPPPKHIGFDRK
jgi:hypothetical protein